MWKFSGCEVQGRGHIKKQVPCQDKTKVIFDNGTYVVALSDGAGSAPLSHYGAAAVVDGITQLLSEKFDDLYSREDGRLVKLAIMEQLNHVIHTQAESLGCEPKDLAATVLAVAVNNDRFVIAHIGDGVIGYLDGNVLKVASAPANGEHANETYFVTSHDAVNQMRIFKGNIKNIAGFVLMSDGTEQSLYNKKNNALSPAVIKLMQRNILLSEDAMRTQLEATFQNVIAQKTQDDCSIALLVRENPVLHPYSCYSYAEKCDLFGIKSDRKSTPKRIARYDAMLELLKKPTDCAVLSRKLHLKGKYTKRRLKRLQELGLVVKQNSIYQLSADRYSK